MNTFLIAVFAYFAFFCLSAMVLPYRKAMLWPMVAVGVLLTIFAGILIFLENILSIVSAIMRFYAIRCLNIALFGENDEKETSTYTPNP